jgi:hypothetical protein
MNAKPVIVKFQDGTNVALVNVPPQPLSHLQPPLLLLLLQPPQFQAELNVLRVVIVAGSIVLLALPSITIAVMAIVIQVILNVQIVVHVHRQPQQLLEEVAAEQVVQVQFPSHFLPIQHFRKLK